MLHAITLAALTAPAPPPAAPQATPSPQRLERLHPRLGLLPGRPGMTPPAGGMPRGAPAAPATLPGTALPPLAPAAPSQAWTASADPSAGGHDYGYALAADGERTYAVGTSLTAAGDYDLAIVALDGFGELAWERLVGGSAAGDDDALQVVVDSNGDVLVAGDTVNTGSGRDMSVLKLDPAGNLLWHFVYDGPGSGYDSVQGGRPLAVNAAGEVYVCGLSLGAGTSYDAVTLKLAAGGRLLWERRWTSPGAEIDDAYALVLDDLGNVYVAAQTFDGVDDAFLTLKYTPDGTLLWERQYDGPEIDWQLVYAIAIDPARNVSVCGFAAGATTGWDFAVVSYDEHGNERWARHYDAGWGQNELPFWVDADDEGNVALGGMALATHFGTRGLIVKYDVDGDLLWARDFYGASSGGTWVSDLAFDAAGDLLVGGRIDGGAPSSADALLRRYSPAGALLSEARYDGANHASDTLSSIDVGAPGDLRAVGSTLGAGGNVDFLVLRR